MTLVVGQHLFAFAVRLNGNAIAIALVQLEGVPQIQRDAHAIKTWADVGAGGGNASREQLCHVKEVAGVEEEESEEWSVHPATSFT